MTLHCPLPPTATPTHPSSGLGQDCAAQASFISQGALLSATFTWDSDWSESARRRLLIRKDYQSPLARRLRGDLDLVPVFLVSWESPAGL